MTPLEKKDMGKLLDKVLKDDISQIFREAGEFIIPLLNTILRPPGSSAEC